MSANGNCERKQGFWRVHRSNWKLAGASLVDVARTDVNDGALNLLEAEWHFPNLARINSQSVTASIVLQPTAMDETLWRISLFESPGSKNCEAIRERLIKLIDRAGERAEARQTEIELASTDDLNEATREGWRFNQEMVEHITRRHSAYWNTPLVDATVMAGS